MIKQFYSGYQVVHYPITNQVPDQQADTTEDDDDKEDELMASTNQLDRGKYSPRKHRFTDLFYVYMYFEIHCLSIDASICQSLNSFQMMTNGDVFEFCTFIDIAHH